MTECLPYIPGLISDKCSTLMPEQTESINTVSKLRVFTLLK